MANESNKDFDLHMELRGDVLYSTCAGPKDNFSVSTKIVEEVSQEAENRGVSKVIIVEDFPNQLSTIVMFQICEIMVRSFRRCTKVAHVDMSSSDLELNRFGETVAVNRGLRIRAFSRAGDAEAWLNRQPNNSNAREG